MQFRRPHHRKSVLAAVVCAVVTAGCGGQSSDAATPAAASSDACRLLTAKELSAVFGGTKKGEVDNTRQQYGISACTWRTDQGTFVAQYWESTGSSAKSEAEGMILGTLDPLKPVARTSVRYENVSVGEQAVAVIEKRDEKRGVIADMATLVAQRGDQILVLIAPSLVQVERAKALKALESLGQSAVSRL